MKLRYLAGRAAADSQRWLLSRRWFPLFRSYARGRDWLYDFCRQRGSRDVGVIFDVGANIGQTSEHLLRYFPTARLHAFELAGTTAARLARNLTAFPNAHAHHLALAAQPGRLRLRLQSHSEVNSLAFATEETGTDTEEVDISTVDLFCTANGIDRLDILKIDAQGSDLDVLRGAETMIRAGRVACVYAEAGFTPRQPDLQDFAALDAHLTARGFVLGGIYEQWWLGPALHSFNVFYLHPSTLPA